MGRKRYTQTEIKAIFEEKNLTLLETFTKTVNDKIKTRCYCGKIFWTIPRSVIRGQCRSCGCYGKQARKNSICEDLQGKKFNRLTVVSLSDYKRPNRKDRWWNCICECGNKNIVTTGDLNCGNIKSCGCLNKDRVSEAHISDLSNKKQEIGKLTAIKIIGKRKNSKCHLWLCRCDCGQFTEVESSSFKSEHTKSCGSCSIVGAKSGKLTVIHDTNKKDRRGQRLWECRCECGNTKIVNTNCINTKQVRSCGCLIKDIIKNKASKHISNFKQKIGKLTVIGYAGTNKRKKNLWLCKCTCGNTTKLQANEIIQEKVKSCGNCKLCRNGVLTSYIALDLHTKIINSGYPTTEEDHHNYKLENGKMADIAIPILNIIVEYDGWYYHKNQLKEDTKRYKEFQKLGWKVLVIRSKNILPKIYTINKRINKLINNESSYEVITCKDWYQ